MPGSCAPSHTVWLQSNFGDMPHAPVSRWLRLAERNTTLSLLFSRKSGEDIPARIRQPIVRIENPEASLIAIVQIAQGKPPGTPPSLRCKSVLFILFFLIRGNPLYQAVA